MPRRSSVDSNVASFLIAIRLKALRFWVDMVLTLREQISAIWRLLYPFSSKVMILNSVGLIPQSLLNSIQRLPCHILLILLLIAIDWVTLSPLFIRIEIVISHIYLKLWCNNSLTKQNTSENSYPNHPKKLRWVNSTLGKKVGLHTQSRIASSQKKSSQ